MGAEGYIIVSIVMYCLSAHDYIIYVLVTQLRWRIADK